MTRSSVASDNPAFASHALSNLALGALQQGHPGMASTFLAEAVAQAHESGDSWVTAIALYRLGIALRDLHDLHGAIERLMESASLWPDHHDQVVLAEAVGLVAGIASDLGLRILAVTLFAAADAYRAANEMPILPDWRSTQEHTIAALHTDLGMDAFAGAWTNGHAMPFPRIMESVADLLQTQADGQTARLNQTGPWSAKADASELTVREFDVLRLLATGKADKEIANELSISRRTVTTHVSSIYGKLGLTSRAAAAAFAVRHGFD